MHGAGILNIAHRGARAYAPENTLAAFAKAVGFGCPMIEIDVHWSKDGELVVHHDDQLARCTDVKTKFPERSSYYVSDFTWSEFFIAFIGCAAGITFLGAALSGFMLVRTLAWERALLTVAAFLLVAPELYSSLLGGVLVVPVLVRQALLWRLTREAG